MNETQKFALPLVALLALLLILKWCYTYLRYALAGIYKIDTMSEPEYEEFLITFVNKLGHKVEHMGTYTDQGIPLVMNDFGKRTLIQAVRHKKVTEVSVQAAIAARDKEHCSEAIVLSNHAFTKKAKQLARHNNVALWSKKELTHPQDKNS